MMKQYMKSVMTMALMLLFTLGAWADPTVTIKKQLDGAATETGTATSNISEGVCTLTVTPASGNYVTVDNITAYAVWDGSMAQAPRRDPGLVETPITVEALDASADPSGETKYRFTMPTDGSNVEVTVNFQSRKALTLDMVTAIADQTYTGVALEPALTIKDGTFSLVKDTHYTVAYSDNVNAGTAKATITGKGIYTTNTGETTSIVKTFTITAGSIADANVVVRGTYTYTGAAIQPTTDNIFVTFNGNDLTAGTDYEIQGYLNNTNAATDASDNAPTVTIAGKGNFTGTATGKFTIAQAKLGDVTIAPISDQTFTGSQITPAVTVTFNDEALSTEEYNVVYGENVNVGIATVTLTSKDKNFVASTDADETTKKTATFKIYPPAPVIAYDETKPYLSTDKIEISLNPTYAAAASGSNTIYYSWDENPTTGTAYPEGGVAAQTGTLTAWVVATVSDVNYESEKVSQNITTIQGYDLWIGDTQVTAANADDVLGNGKVSFTESGGADAAPTYTLTLNGAALTAPVKVGLVNLTIDIQGTNSITTEEKCIQKMENTTPAVTFTSTSDVVGSLTLNGDAGVNGVGEYNEGSFTISDELALVLKKDGYIYSNQYWFTDGSTKEAKLSPSYGVTVGGMQICPDNATDVIGDGIGGGDDSGMVSFDKDTHTLTLTNASLSGIIRSSLPDLTIELVGNNSIYSGGDRILQAGVAVNMTIQSSADVKGSLSMHKGYSSTEKGNFVDDNVTLTISAPLAVISGSLEDNSSSNDYYATIGEAYDLWVAGIRVTPDNAAAITGKGITGTVTYIRDENTLMLDNATIIPDADGWGVVYSGTAELFAIALNGDNTVKGAGGYGAILYSGQKTGQTATQETSPALQFIKTYDAQPCSLTLNGISGFDDDAILFEDGLVAAGDLTKNQLTYIEEGYGIQVGNTQLSEHNTVSGVTYYASNHTLSLSGVVSGDQILTTLESLTVGISGINKLGTIEFNGDEVDENTQTTLTFVKNDQSTAPENSLTLENSKGGTIYGFSQVNIQEPLMLKTPETTPDNWDETSKVEISDVTEVINLGLTVSGILVTNANAVDVLNDGKVSYANGILTLNEATLAIGITSSMDQLKIVLKGESSIAGTIAGAGTLYFGADAANAKLTFTTTAENAVSGFTEVKYLNGLRMKSVASGFDLSVPSDYNLMVNGIPVTSDNRKDVLNDGGSVIYDGEYTLILTNAVLTQKIQLSSENTLDSLYIHLAGQNNTIETDDNVIVATEKPNMELHFVTNGNSPGKLVYTSTNASNPTLDGAFAGFKKVSYDNELEAVLSGKTITIAQKIEPIINDDPTSGKDEKADVNFTDASTGMDNTSGTNLSNTIISDILFTLNDNGTQESPDGYDGEKVVINSKMSDKDLADAMNLEPGTDAFAEKFNGLTFKLPASTGTISIEAWSDCGHQMCVKIGDQTATYITLTDSPKTYNIDYTCSSDTYVYIYLPQPSSSSAPRRGRIGPKSGVSGGLGSIAIKSNSLVSVESSQPASSYMLLDIVAADAIISGAVRGEGLSFNDPTITALEDNMFLTGGGASSAPRRAAPALKISSDLPFIDMRGTSIKNMEVSRSSGPFNGVPENIFIYMPEGNTTSEKNVVIGDVCNRMELKAELSGENEAKPFKVSKNFTAAQATLMRTFAAGGDDSKATIYLPYAIPQETANQLGTFYKFDGISGDEVQMTKVTSGGLKANMPYIFQAKAGGVVNPEVKLVTVQGFPGETEGFKGVYEPTTCGGENWYGYAAEEVDGASVGQFVKLGAGASIAPFRAYMVADGNVPSYAIRWGGVDEETTAIEKPEIQTVNERKPVEGWYTLTGARLLGQPTKPGLYIYNGRTVVVK